MSLSCYRSLTLPLPVSFNRSAAAFCRSGTASTPIATSICTAPASPIDGVPANAAMPLVMPLIFPQSIYRGNPTARPALSADAPPLEVNPSGNLRRQREADGKFANTYGWIDRDHKVVRIPVARAIERLLQTGLPDWPSR